MTVRYSSARYLEKAGQLEKIISPVPHQRSQRFGVSRERTAGLTPLGVWDYAFQHWGPRSFQQRHQLAFSAAFDEIAARMIGEGDVVNCWCSTALRTIRAAHRRGVPVVLEVASAHIVAQAELIREEFGRYGGHDRDIVTPGVVARTIAEYREADVIVVTSSFVRRTFIEQGGPASKIIVVPYGVDPAPMPQRRPHSGPPRIVFVGGCSLRKGIPHLIEALDDRYWRNRVWGDLPIDNAPSFYWRQNNAASYITDRSGIALRHSVGVENILWSSDYPHHGNDWPYSRKVIDETLGHIPTDERRAITGDNAARIWHLDI